MLQIYNTFTQKKEIFRPLVPKEISLYVCGITVYDFCHLGHARVFVAFDVIVRFLRASGWKVTYVRNITDIDDKIINRANQNKESIEKLTERFIEAMDLDMDALNVLAPDKAPRATNHIHDIISMIEKLQEKGFAYIANNDVYFQVEKFSKYGQLSHKDLEQLQSGARIEIVEEKRSPLDFVLWKKAKSNEPSWDSPWGKGRPGWHIECSAMSTHCLGNTFDIHGGGADLVFPHHENERAQSECATGVLFANTWMHIGFVQVDKEKMSKSLNNFFTIREILNQYDPEVVRYFLINSHYRSPVNFSDELLTQAKNTLDTLYNALKGINLSTVSISDKYYQRFVEAMNDDFNTPLALSVLFDCVRELNILREKNDATYLELAATLKSLGNILGILERDPQLYFQGETHDVSYINQLINEREQARNHKNWQRADEIRQELITIGVVLEDTAGKTTWRKI